MSCFMEELCSQHNWEEGHVPIKIFFVFFCAAVIWLFPTTSTGLGAVCRAFYEISFCYFLGLDVFPKSFDVVVCIFPRNLPESSQPSFSHHCDLTKARTPSVGIA